LPSELNAAYLLAQLEQHETITNQRMARWNQYNTAFQQLAADGKLTLMQVPAECEHNAHMYYFKLRDLAQRTAMIEHLKQNDVNAVFHYIPLHSAKAGMQFGRFAGEDRYTTADSERLLRLPLFFGMTEDEGDQVIKAVYSFFA